MRWGLRYQLLVSPLLLLFAVAGITTWTALASAERARQQIETRMRDVAETLNSPPFYEISNPILQQLRRLSGAEFALERFDGSRAIRTLTTLPDELPPPIEAVDDLQRLQLGYRVIADGKPYLCSGIRLLPPRNSSTLYIFYPEALWRDALWEAVRPSLLVGGVAGIMAVVLAVAVGQGLTRRVEELERRTRQIASGDFSPMPLPPRDDEIRDLAASVNDMAERLARLQEAMRRSERLRLLGQVSGGLAHQLRNGVQGARLAVQLHQRDLARGEKPDPSALDVALRQLTLVETNLKRFLDLGSRRPAMILPCSLNALITETVALIEPKCKHAGIALHWQPAVNNAVIQGDGAQLQELFLNLMTNAVEAAGPQGDVEVTLQEIKGKPVIEICDSGPGPTDQVASRLFEPFVTGKTEGIGLGLAVARQVAEGHNGQITWTRRENQTCFRVELGNVAPEGALVVQ